MLAADALLEVLKEAHMLDNGRKMATTMGMRLYTWVLAKAK
jgi:hypothetical protein